MIFLGDCLEVLKQLESETVDCCVTSPPYYGLRDYGKEDQIGLEETPEQYIEKLAEVFKEVTRVLKPDGTIWIVIGDSYCRSGKNRNSDGMSNNSANNYKQGTNKGAVMGKIGKTKSQNCKPKDLIGIPWMLAFYLRNNGLYLRQDIIWEKPNPMPESVRDRCTKSHEYIFLFSKSKQYYFNAEAIAEPVADSTVSRLKQDILSQNGSTRAVGKTNGNMKAVINARYGGKKYTNNPDVFNRTKSGNLYEYRPKRNKRDVWRVTTKPFKEAHFATFPPDLIEPCIMAGSKPGVWFSTHSLEPAPRD